MVKYIFYLLFFGMGMLEAAPVIEASIDKAQAHYPLEGTITITHRKQEKIDPHSFQLDKQPLETLFVRDTNMPSDATLLVTVYSFQLPAQKQPGLYILPTVSVKIDNQVYQSIPASYEVKGASSSDTSPTDSASSGIIFRLEAFAQGPTTLYPGERTKLIYRISYNRSIDLSLSELPLVHPRDFQKIGDVQVKDYQKEEVTVQDIIQEIEANKTGNFSLGPSTIEGYAYSLNAANEKVYESSKLHAEAPVIKIEVKPFPTAQQPGSFNGALGQIQVEAHLSTPASVAVGDTSEVQIKIQGVQNLTDLQLPSLQCQPGFSGFFQMSDLPPPADVEGKVKTFDLTLRPLSTLVTEIPPLEVSSFDPATGKYVIQNTAPIPLEVYAPDSPDKVTIPEIPLIPYSFFSLAQWPPLGLTPLEIEGQPVTWSQFSRPWIQTPALLWFIPLGICLWLLQRWFYLYRKKHPHPQIPTSEQLLHQALHKQAEPLQNVHLLEKACWWRLWEKGLLPHETFDLENVSLESIKTLIMNLQAVQYGTQKTYDLHALQRETKQVLKAI